MDNRLSLCNDSSNYIYLKGNLPFEKYERFGIETLSDAELFAMILRTGSRDKDIFQTVSMLFENPKIVSNGLIGLFEMSKEELIKIPGIGKIKASQIISVMELSKRIKNATFKEKINFQNASLVSEFYMDRLRCESREKVIGIFLDNKCNRICDEIISIGTINFSILTPREVFSSALKINAVSIIILHNHPSGDPSPSKEDINVTNKLKEGASILGLNFLDHIILGDNRYFSMKEHGFL